MYKLSPTNSKFGGLYILAHVQYFLKLNNLVHSAKTWNCLTTLKENYELNSLQGRVIIFRRGLSEDFEFLNKI